MSKKKLQKKFIPVTPAGTPCGWLASSTEAEAWDKLLEDAKHMPYNGKEGFQRRGYTVVEVQPPGEPE